jgi:hypothetical protein
MTASEDGQDAPRPRAAAPLQSKDKERKNERADNSSAGCRNLTSP